ncbi:MAG: BlaI/MecI/CopY family transcriptional regulator [Bacillota bacterium]|nr:BlaI/MecI/CopY family transcriptional regulator [Bacillota bacterium]
MASFNEFRPHEKGMKKVLGGLEADIMELMWKTGRCCVRDVHRVLRENKDLAYTTVMTVMARLATKGLLTRELVEDAYYYETAVSKPEFESSIVSHVLDGLLESFSEQTISQLLGKAEAKDKNVVDALAQIIDGRRKESRR